MISPHHRPIHDTVRTNKPASRNTPDPAFLHDLNRCRQASLTLRHIDSDRRQAALCIRRIRAHIRDLDASRPSQISHVRDLESSFLRTWGLTWYDASKRGLNCPSPPRRPRISRIADLPDNATILARLRAMNVAPEIIASIESDFLAAAK